MPEESVTTVRCRPVAVFCTVTFTPGRARPCSSLIRPSRVPLVACAKPVTAAHAKRDTIANRSHTFIKSILPDRSVCTLQCKRNAIARARKSFDSRRPDYWSGEWIHRAGSTSGDPDKIQERGLCELCRGEK